jgi:hypothetical protein
MRDWDHGRCSGPVHRPRLRLYTGSIYEVKLIEFPSSARLFGRTLRQPRRLVHQARLPGVGISIGLSRLFAKMLGRTA